MVKLKLSNIFDNLDEFENRLLNLNGTKFEYLLDDIFKVVSHNKADFFSLSQKRET